MRAARSPAPEPEVLALVVVPVPHAAPGQLTIEVAYAGDTTPGSGPT